MSAELKALTDELGKTVKSFQEENDKRIDEIKANGEARAETEQKVDKLNDGISAIEEKLAALATKMNRPDLSGGNVVDEKAVKQAASFMKFLRVGKDALDAEDVQVLKDMFVSDDTTGGYFAPPEFINEIIKDVVDFSPIRSVARIRQTSNRMVQVPKRTQTASAQWVGEREDRDETQNPAYGLEEVPVHEMSARADISETNVEDAQLDLGAEIQMEFSEQFGVLEGAAFVNGNAVKKPEGILVNADVEQVNSGHATLLTDDGLIDLFYTLKDAYARNATWLMARLTIATIRKFKDGDDQYIWQPGLQAGQPSLLLGRPILEAVDMPAIGAGTLPIAIGDFRRGYTIIDRTAMTMVRDPFSLSEDGLIKFVGRRRVGGQVVQAEAIKIQVVSA